MKRVAAVGMSLVLLGCSTSSDPVVNRGEDVAEVAVDAVADVTGTWPDESATDAPVPIDDVGFELIFDVSEDDAPLQPGCEPGEGCFLDPCQENGDCQSGWCVDHMGDAVCTISCQEECPPGWSCQQVAGTDPDLVFVCVSNVANLCKPCASGNNCKSVGGAEDVCLDYGAEGSFCGGGCVSDDDCPWGFSCLTTVTVDGISTLQCVADAGVCPCTSSSVALGLWTACESTSEAGTCTGKRVCTEEGLSPCDAAAPVAEFCNGLDDDCDGNVDEPAEVGGDLINLCFDDNDCTQDVCDGEAGCSYLPLEGDECKDGNPCTVADHCEQGVCIGSQVECDDSNPCTDDACNETGGCIFESNSADCDDGDACTLGDHCSGSVCAGEAASCECQVDDDCAALEDGNLCNGTLECDTSKLPHLCRVEPGTEILCPEPEGPDAPCLDGACDPATGACSFEPAGAGSPCEDGDQCSLGDTCLDGVCSGGVAVNCNDGTACTDDQCLPGQGCVHTHNAAPCNDGNVCTLGDACAVGECVSGSETLVCDDSNVCVDVSCSPELGCLSEANAAACSDGNACTTGDHCLNKVCVHDSNLSCDDDNLCTNDSCDPALGCVQKPNSVPCSDGDVCTLGDACAAGECVGGETLVCDDGNVCTDDSCSPDSGCLSEANAVACDDGNACTGGDHCLNKACVHDSTLFCDDDNLCTNDSCDPAQGCVHKLNTVPCTDGDLCTVDDVCHLGECLSSGTLYCDDGNPCTTDSCSPETGCKYEATSGDCDDGNACTLAEQCSNGFCVAGAMLGCDDNNVCTTDSCDPQTGCLHTFNEVPCNDDDICTINEVCQDGECLSDEVLACDDLNPCTDDSCAPDSGCIHTPNAAACTDDNECTTGDHCGDGECVTTGILTCDDDELCTNDNCDSLQGCVYSANNLPCDDANVCTENDLCAGGECVPGQEIDCPDDGNTCTAESCDPDSGCLHTPVADCCGNGVTDAGEECDDGNQVGGDGCDADCKSGVGCSNAAEHHYQVVPGIWACVNNQIISTYQENNSMCAGGWTPATYKLVQGLQFPSLQAHQAMGTWHTQVMPSNGGYIRTGQKRRGGCTPEAHGDIYINSDGTHYEGGGGWHDLFNGGSSCTPNTYAANNMSHKLAGVICVQGTYELPHQ